MAQRSSLARIFSPIAPYVSAATAPFSKPWHKRAKYIPPVKYTVEPQGIWAVVHRLFAVDSTRSSGIPLNAQFRLPAPGALDPNTYDDPVTRPAGDIANNPYWKRDVRRNYPKLSTVTQGDVVALLSVGSQAEPKDDVLQLGDAGKQQLVQVKQQGEEKGLASFLQSQKSVASSVLGPDGLPPYPTPVNGSDIKKYHLGEQSYPSKYPSRNFV